MLVLYTNYDSISAALAGCADRFLTTHPAVVTAHLGPNAGEWGDPHGWVQLNPAVPLLFFGHGSDVPAAFLSQTQTPFLVAAQAAALQGRFVCGICCFSAGVGAHAAPVGATLVGYRGVLEVITQPKYAALLAECVMAGLTLAVTGATARAICQATQDAYVGAAQKLYRGSLLDCFAAPYFELNAAAVTVVGNPLRRP